jgi:hypothetical protein
MLRFLLVIVAFGFVLPTKASLDAPLKHSNSISSATPDAICVARLTDLGVKLHFGLYGVFTGASGVECFAVAFTKLSTTAGRSIANAAPTFHLRI